MADSTRTSHAGGQEWAQAADKAKESAAAAGEMAGHAALAVGAMATQAAGRVGKKADDLTATAGVGIQELGDKIGESVPQAGVLGSVSRAVTRSVKDGGEYLERAKLSGTTGDITQWIRRNPFRSLLIGIGVGWFAWRSLRS